MVKTVLNPEFILQSSIKLVASDAQYAWLCEQADKLQSTSGDKALYIALGQTPKHFADNDIMVNLDDKLIDGWAGNAFSLAEAARLFLLLSKGVKESEFPAFLDKLCNTADKGELVAFYKGLPLYPNPDSLILRAAEGIRSNIKPVFEAVAHNNPYPSQYLDESAWNQMVLKALFIESKLYPIIGLDQRANLRLAAMLCDYAHERWSAGRTVSPELWRCVGPFAEQHGINDFKQLFKSGTEIERQAALLALKHNQNPKVKNIINAFLSDDNGNYTQIIDGDISWASLAT